MMSDREPLLASHDSILRPAVEVPPQRYAFGALLRAEAGAAFACTLLSTLLLTAALLALDFLDGARATSARMADSARIAVVAGPNVASGDADALKARIAAIPGVTFERVRSRQEVLADVQRLRAGWTEAPALPEIWLFRFADSATTTADGAAQAVKAIAGLAGVEAVRRDANWDRAIDGGRYLADRFLTKAVYGLLALAAIALLAVYYVFGRALSGSGAVNASGSTKAFAHLTLLLSCISAVLALATEAGVASEWPRMTREWMTSAGVANAAPDVRLMHWNQALTVAASAIFLALLGVLAARRRE